MTRISRTLLLLPLLALAACQETDTISVLVTPGVITLETGQTRRFTSTVRGDTDDHTVTWSVEGAPGAGTITADGTYTAPETAGTYRVIAASNADRTRKGSATVTVIERSSAVSVTVEPAFIELSTNSTFQFNATVLGTTDTAIDWSVEEGAAGGSIDAEGLYTAPAAVGIYHVVATLRADATRKASATVNVKSGRVISITPTTATRYPGESATFTATITGGAENEVDTVVWAVKAGGAGGTIDSAGVYTAPDAPGTDVVVARSTIEPSISVEAEVTIAARPELTVTIDPTTATLMINTTKQFTATVEHHASNAAVTWEVVEANGGSVDENGLYTAPATAGTFHVRVISVEDPSRSATAEVIVTEPPAVTVKVEPGTVSLHTGRTQQFTATVQNATDTSVTWSVQEAEGGTIDENGVYTAPDTAGTYRVEARSVADPSRVGVATVAVTLPPPVELSITPDAVSLVAGGVQTFVAVVNNATDTTVTWSVLEEGGGTITPAGLYTAPARAGTWHVVATSNEDPSKTATATIEVASSAVVAVTPDTAAVIAGESFQFAATVTSAIDPAVTWSVQEGATGGTIDATGLYTAPMGASGTFHVVAASVEDPTRTASATVTIVGLPALAPAAHYAADRIAGNGGTLPTDGAVITGWSDLSGNGRHLAQTDQARQPIWHASMANGRAAVEFDGSADFLASELFAAALPQPNTVFIVFRGPNGVTNLMDAPQGAAERHRIQLAELGQGTGNFGVQLIAGSFGSLGQDQLRKGGWNVLGAIYDGANSIMHVNGRGAKSAGNPGSQGIGGIQLGLRMERTAAPGIPAIAEVLVYDEQLTPEQIAEVEAYLQARYPAAP